MRFTLTFKDPDMDIQDLADVMFDKTGQDYYNFVHQWTDGEYVSIQFDTVAGTAVVLKQNEAGVNDHWDKDQNVVARVDHARFSNEADELKRQLNEAADSLAKEEDKTTPYARGLLKFIIDTRDQIKLHDEWDSEGGSGPDYGIEPAEVEFDKPV